MLRQAEMLNSDDKSFEKNRLKIDKTGVRVYKSREHDDTDTTFREAPGRFAERAG